MLIFSLSVLPACAGLQSSSLGNDDLLQSDQAQINPRSSTGNTFSEDAYHLLVAEIAIFRGHTDIACLLYTSPSPRD